MKWPKGGFDPLLCRAVDSDGQQCSHVRERDGKTRFRTYCRGHRYRLRRYGDLAADVPLGEYRGDKATPRLRARGADRPVE